jgi:hypothetical protein
LIFVRPCLGRFAGGSRGAGDYAHDVALLHDQEILAIDAHLGARPFAEQHPVADLDVERLNLASLIPGARAGGNDLALLRLLLGGVWNDDPAFGLLLGVDAADDYTVMQRRTGVGTGE